MTRLIIWRHGNTDWNATDRVQGQTDIPLNDLGREQAAAAAAALAARHPDAIVASDLRRAAETAATLAALTGLPVREDTRLRERYYGHWQGLTMAEIARQFPDDYARWRAGQPIGGDVESLDDLAKRAGRALLDAAEARPGGTVVVATHGGTARLGCAAVLSWPPEMERSLAGLDNCHWSELRHDERRGWQLRAHNVGA